MKYFTMAAYSYLMLILEIVLCCLEMFNVVKGKVCYKVNKKSNTKRHHSIYNKVYFCCDNSERLNEGCRECKIGFLSVHGEPCKPCSGNSFGRKCVQYCSCKIYESCHNVFGCISLNTLPDRIEKVMTKSTVYTEQDVTTIQDLTEKTKTTVNYHKDKHGDEEKCRSSVEVVIFAFVGLLMDFGIGVIFMFFKQFIKRNKRQDPTIAESNASLEIRGDPINAYEEIDDTIFFSHDANIYQDEENSDTSSDSSNTEQRSENTQNTDYLNPYQPIIPTTDPHMYMTPVTNIECSNTDQEATDVRSSSFINDDKTDGSLRSYSDNLMSRPLHYVELEINTLFENNKEPDQYVNTSINANQPTENKASTQKTQYVEIVHTV